VRRTAVVIGGGVAGLAAAHRLVEHARASAPLDVILLERSERLGGSISTEHSGGFTIERGADAFLTEKPWALALCERLGIGERLIGTRAGDRRTYVVHQRRLVPLPDGFVLLAPTDVGALVRSPLFSWRGKLRMALDLVLPRRPDDATDETLAAFVRRRLGREALERAADPLVGGIYTADPERLSLAATMPRFLELERRYRSLIRALHAEVGARATAGARYGLFASHAEGMGALVAAVASRLPEGVVRLRTPVESLARDAQTWRVCSAGHSFAADAVVLATPGFVAAELLAPLDPPLASDLAAIEYASSATITLGFRSADVPALRGFGFVVPAIERRPLLACTFSSRKWANRAPEGHELLRAFVGGARRPEVAELPDDVLTATVRHELEDLLGVTAAPVLTRIHRHPRAMPQYAVGHLDRLARIDARLAGLPGLALAGGAYRGLGIPDCVRSGEAAADAVAG